MVIPSESSKSGRNPYQRRRRAMRRRSSQDPPSYDGIFALFLGGFCVTIVGFLTLTLIVPNNSFGCSEIQALLSFARLEHDALRRHQSVGNNSTHNNIRTGGGVVIFWHLAKSGGSSVRGNFASFSEKVDYRPLLKSSDWNRIVPQVEKRLAAATNARSKRVLFVELHGQGTFSNQQWDTTLQTWRDMADEYNNNLFVFTVLREPTSHAISYYNYFHKSRRSRRALGSTSIESDFKSSLIANRQCTTLAQLHSPRSLSIFSRHEGTTKAHLCANVYSKLLKHFDWIGTTETLSTETLPLVHLLLSKWTRTTSNGTTHFASYNVGKAENERLRLDDMANSTRKFIQQSTCLDRALWQQVQQDYSASQVRQKYQLE